LTVKCPCNVFLRYSVTIIFSFLIIIIIIIIIIYVANIGDMAPVSGIENRLLCTKVEHVQLLGYMYAFSMGISL